MAYKLKPGQFGFQVTKEGEFEYKTFKPGEVYDRIPEEEKDRFEEIGEIQGGDEK